MCVCVYVCLCVSVCECMFEGLCASVRGCYCVGGLCAQVPVCLQTVTVVCAWRGCGAQEVRQSVSNDFGSLLSPDHDSHHMHHVAETTWERHGAKARLERQLQRFREVCARAAVTNPRHRDCSAPHTPLFHHGCYNVTVAGRTA